MRLAGLGVRGATSPTEVMAKTLVFTGPEYADWDWQAPVSAAGRARTVDMLHRGAALAVEFDGEAYHAGAKAWARDRQRDAELAGQGILTLRLSFANLRDRPQWCRHRVKEALCARLPTLSADN